MSLVDESREAYLELQAVMTREGDVPVTITFNGVTRPCVSQSLNLKRAQQLQGYEPGKAQEVTMLLSDFADFEGIQDRVSKVSVGEDDELIYLASDTHPNSATIHLFLVSGK